PPAAVGIWNCDFLPSESIILGIRAMKLWRIALMLVAAAFAWEGGATAQGQDKEIAKDEGTTLDSATMDMAIERLKSTNPPSRQDTEREEQTSFVELELEWIRPTLVLRRNSVFDHVTNQLNWTGSPRISFGSEWWSQSRWEIAYQFLNSTSPQDVQV